MRKLLDILIVFTFILASISLALVGYTMSQKEKFAYVDINVLYESYKAKQERQEEYEFMLNKQNQVLDSIQQVVNLKYNQYEIQQTEDLAQEIIQLQNNYQRLDEEFNSIAQEQRQRFIDELMTQINEQVQVYGENQGFEIILGATGNGSLMYATKGKDITQDVLAYINELYEG